MNILIGFLLPVAVYAVIWAIEGRLPLSIRRWIAPIALATLGAFAVAVATIVFMYTNAKWPRSTQIAWTAVRTAPGAASLVIGGDRQTDIVGWPNGSFQPRFAVSHAGKGNAAIALSGGGAFIIDPATGGVVNGRLLAPGSPMTLDGYRFELVKGFWIFRPRRIVVTAPGGTRVADIALRQRSSRNRFFGLDYLNSRSDESVPKYAPYENWSRGVLVALAGTDEVRLLDPAYSRTFNCVFPCTLDLRWRRLTQRIVVDRLPSGSFSMSFERPWRRTSPLPPKDPTGPWQMVVTRHPEPGDRAFVLPFGGGAPARGVLTLDDSSGVPLLRSGGANVANSAPRQRVVSSVTGIQAGNLIFDFATAVDVLNPAAVAVSLFAGFLVLVLGFALTRTTFTREQQWLIYGLAFVAWTLLAFRTGLAVRYAAAPELLDRLAIKGVRLSLLAAAIVPGALLLASYIRARALQDRQPSSRRRDTGMRWPLAYLGLLIAAAIFEIAAPSRIWPDLPRTLDPSFGLGGMVRILVALFVAAYFAIALYAVSTISKPALPVRVYETIASKYGREFWRSITSGVGLGALGPIVLAAAALLLVVPWIVTQAGSKFAQEVIAPLFFTLVPAALWLSGVSHFRKSKTTRLWIVRAVIAALVTVAIPVAITPVAISDPGSMLATSSIFLPLGLLLLLSPGARRAGVIVCAIFAAGLVAVIVAYFNVETVLPVGGKSVAGNMPSRVFVYKRGAQVPGFILRQSEALQDAYEHTWENRAIAHEGGWQGLGFGNSPTRRSRVGQETLQADSVFSFFILGDYGVVGGLSLLAIYLAPLLFFLIRRRELRLAEAFGLLISASFFLEAVAHAAMNLGLLPFAGRNLPLLAANSPTDVVKWACLFVVAAQTPFWSTNRDTDATLPGTVVEPRHQPLAVFGFAGIALVLLITIGVSAGRIVSDPRFGEPFTWDQILDEVQRLADQGHLTVDASMRVVLHDPQQLGEGSMLIREINAFNQLSRDEKLGDPPNSQLLARLFSITQVREFNRILREESAQQQERPPGRPPLFRLVELPQFADEAGEIPVVGEQFRVIPNPGFNTRISFRTARSEGLPVLGWSARRWGSFLLRGNSFTVEVPNRPVLPHENRRVTLTPSPTRDFLEVRNDDRSSAPRGELWLNVPVGNAMKRKMFVRFSVENGVFFLDNPPGGFLLRIGRNGRDIRVRPRERVRLESGDTVRIALNIGVDPQFTIEERHAIPLVGPAWVAGVDRLTTDSMSPFPWTTHLSTAFDREWERLGPTAALARYRSLTIHHDLQSAAQTMATAIGSQLHQRRLNASARSRLSRRRVSARDLRNAVDDVFPPRVALSIISIPSGEVLALAGHPRMTGGDVGAACGADAWCPASNWIDETAPSYVRVRYGGDRNFDRIEMGSSTKPLFAAAAMQVHPGIERQLHVAGPAGEEKEVFGIPVAGRKGWKTRGSAQWTDFTTFMAQSDNRYQVRLGFLALAERNATGILSRGTSPSAAESMDGVRPWHAYPRWPALMQLSSAKPDLMERVDDAPMSKAMKRMFGVGVKQGDYRDRHYSFWSGQGSDDLRSDAAPTTPANVPPTTTAQPPAAPAERVSRVFDAISPETANIALDYIRAPRQYVSTLLGGNENRWANVDFAGAFGTAVLGAPVVPHIVPMPTVAAAPERIAFSNVAARLRPALEAVVRSGTAAFAQERLRPTALRQFTDLKIYAKTGTLAVGDDHATTSRLVIAFVRWENEATGRVRKGVVLSLVGQHAAAGDATRWMGQFVEENADAIAQQLR